ASNKRLIASGYTDTGKVKSLIAGYYDKHVIQYKHDNIEAGNLPCRTTAYTRDNPEQWQTLLPLMKSLDKAYSRLEPDTHERQLTLASLTPDYQIDNTA